MASLQFDYFKLCLVEERKYISINAKMVDLSEP